MVVEQEGPYQMLPLPGPQNMSQMVFYCFQMTQSVICYCSSRRLKVGTEKQGCCRSKYLEMHMRHWSWAVGRDWTDLEEETSKHHIATRGVLGVFLVRARE